MSIHELSLKRHVPCDTKGYAAPQENRVKPKQTVEDELNDVIDMQPAKLKSWIERKQPSVDAHGT